MKVFDKRGGDDETKDSDEVIKRLPHCFYFLLLSPPSLFLFFFSKPACLVYIQHKPVHDMNQPQ